MVLQFIMITFPRSQLSGRKCLYVCIWPKSHLLYFKPFVLSLGVTRPLNR